MRVSKENNKMKIIAEIGLNHDGNFNLIFEMVKVAKLAGADAVKFQFGWRGNKDELNYIDIDRANQLKRWCEYIEIEMFASIINKEGFEIAKQIDIPIYKIASRTVRDDLELCEQIIAEGKPTYISLGMWNQEGYPFSRKNIYYIYTKSLYPTFPWDLKDMPKKFNRGGYYGYSDHTYGIEACILAISRGAQYIEKHLTLNKASQVIRDHISSATPAELNELVRIGKPLSNLVKALQETEA